MAWKSLKVFVILRPYRVNSAVVQPRRWPARLARPNAKMKKDLVDLYKALSQDKPSKGDEKDWKTRTTALVYAATKAAKGDEKAAGMLPKLAACAECHKLHK